MPFDLSLFRLLNSLAGTSGAFDALVVFFATYAPFIVAATITLTVVAERSSRKRMYEISFVALTLLLSRGLVAETIRFFYNRPRPFAALGDAAALIVKNAAEPSFPSGHATFFFAFVAAYYMLGHHRGWGHVLLAGTVLMGIARVIAGVHYPLDILAGAVIGWGSAVAVRRVLPKPALAEEAKASD